MNYRYLSIPITNTYTLCIHYNTDHLKRLLECRHVRYMWIPHTDKGYNHTLIFIIDIYIDIDTL